MLNVFSFLVKTMPGMPPEGWWLAALVVFLLGFAAAVDAHKGCVPDPFIFAGLFFTTAIEGFYAGWPYAGEHLAIALATGFLLYLVNEACFRVMKRDAFGMGDAKWTVLAVSCFGPLAGCAAWIVGAWLSLGWMGILRLSRKPIARVHFAPFLFIGLLAGIYWLRLR